MGLIGKLTIAAILAIIGLSLTLHYEWNCPNPDEE